jgi:fluoride exporter
MLRNFLLVGAGGALGSILRYAVASLLPRIGRGFPWATFTVNLAGCFIIGILAGLAPRSAWLSGSGWALLATGLCGGFTTFSAFALDGIKLFQSGANLSAITYIVMSLVLGILLCYAGYLLIAAPNAA